MKKLVKALIGIGVVLCAIIITVGALVGVAQKAIDDSEETQFTNTWMSYILDDAKVTDIVIPGSHDSGTNGMMWMAQCQEKSVADQLACGTRYVDLRVKKKGGELIINHTVVNGQKLSKVLGEIKQFLDTHTSEFLLVDFQNFSGDDGVDIDAFNMAIDTLGDKVVKNDTSLTDLQFVESLTLGAVRGKCLFLWGNGEINDDNDSAVFVRDKNSTLRENSVFHSYYTRKNNTRPSSAYISKSIPEYIELFKAQNDGFFLLQAQLTDPVLAVGPQALEGTHNKNMSAYINSLKDSADLQYINIIMRDFVGARKNCEIIALNLYKGLVANQTQFEAGLALTL